MFCEVFNLKKSTIVCIVSLCVSVGFLALIGVWKPFCLFASLSFLTSLSIPSYIVLVNYVRHQNELKEKRFVDAYLYADEQQNDQKMKDFKYDKKTERHLRYAKYNNFTSLFALAVVWLLAIVLVVLSIKIVFF